MPLRSYKGFQLEVILGIETSEFGLKRWQQGFAEKMREAKRPLGSIFGHVYRSVALLQIHNVGVQMCLFFYPY
jgi:hypothetical protein